MARIDYERSAGRFPKTHCVFEFCALSSERPRPGCATIICRRAVGAGEVMIRLS